MGLPGQVDCDVHPAVTLKALIPYLDPFWQEQVRVRGMDDMDLSSYPPSNPISGRPDWRSGSEKPGLNLEQLRKHVLADLGSSVAICNVLHGGPALPNIDLNAALCRATNQWLAREWLDKEPRLRASIVVPLHNAAFAVEEIERCASDKRFVQVLLLARSEIPLGRRENWPIYEAAERHGLAIGVHAGSTYRHALTYLGWPSYFIEEYASHAQAFQGQLLSLLYEGVLDKFPGLHFVMLESGVSWLPSFIWRAATTWKGMRIEVPWLNRSPSEVIRERVRLTIQPFDVPDEDGVMGAFLDQLNGEHMLLFASDYPHWQFDGDAAMPHGISPALTQKIAVANPLEAYPRLREEIR